MKKIEEELRAGAMPKGAKLRLKKLICKTAYVAAVCRFADMDLIAQSEIQIRRSIRCMAQGAEFLPGIFRDRGVQHVAIRQEVNPLFPGYQS